MKKNVAIGILRAWIALGIICVPVLYYESDAILAFGCIVVVAGFFLLRWVINAFTNGSLNLSIKSVFTKYKED